MSKKSAITPNPRPSRSGIVSDRNQKSLESNDDAGDSQSGAVDETDDDIEAPPDEDTDGK